jgi:hypothetical protein
LRYFFRKRQPEVTRILLVESGSRYLFEELIGGIRATWGPDVFVDLVTCYAGLPKGFSPETSCVYRVTDYRGREGRRQLFRELLRNRYSILGIICSAEPIMTKWKWALAFRLPAKVFVLNENGDYFWLDYGHWQAMRQFVLFRAGLAGAGAVRTLARLIFFPFTLSYLLIYAGTVHLWRSQRKGWS